MTPTLPPGRYAVLGASGLLGTHLLARLAAMPEVRLRAVSRRPPPGAAAAGVEWLPCDLADPAQAAAAVADCDRVFIAAGVLATAPVLARDPVGPVLANLRVVTNALEAAWRAGVEKCLWVSSTTGYPPVEETLSEDRMFEDDPPPGWHGIGWVTRHLETQCRWYAERLPRKMRAAAIRPTMIYGEHDHFDEASAHFLPSLMRRVVAREKPIEVWGNGEQTRDLVHADDVARAAILAMAHPADFGVWNVGAGESVSVNACLSLLLELDGFADAEVTHLTDRPTSISNRRFDTARAAAELDFVPEIGLREGLRRTLAWYRAHRESLAAAAAH